MARQDSTQTASKSDIDPRIAARRDAVETEKRRRRGRWWLVVAIFAAVLVGVWFVTRTPILDIDRIAVDGAAVTTVDDIVAASGLRTGEPLLEVDSSNAAARIKELPYIATAKVARQWDGLVTITVTERVPVALAVTGDGVTMVVDRSGRVLAPHVAEDGVAVVLMGVEAGPVGTTIETVPGALELASLLSPGMRTRVASISTGPDGSLTLALVPQGTVVLGPPNDLAAKVEALRIVMAQVDQRDLASINVVNPSTPVVVRTPK